MEQVVSYEFEQTYYLKALYFILKTRIKQKDFYEAYHTLNRLPSQINHPKIEGIKSLIEGVKY